MPIYEYKCDEGHGFEVVQRFSDDALSSCTQCGSPARRVLSAPAIHFKGSGFYTTDYGAKSKAYNENGSDGGSGSDSDSGSGEKSGATEGSSGGSGESGSNGGSSGDKSGSGSSEGSGSSSRSSSGDSAKSAA